MIAALGLSGQEGRFHDSFIWILQLIISFKTTVFL